tara:strand:- start:2241 stop:3056 length:816 start_codon:yes stop_codon:yes gene_type:complete
VTDLSRVLYAFEGSIRKANLKNNFKRLWVSDSVPHEKAYDTSGETIVSIESKVIDITGRLRVLLKQSGRDLNDVTIVAVTKKQSTSAIQEVVSAGINHIGESYLQEALNKQIELNDDLICWHFIGQVQSNKCQLIAKNFSWVHSVSSEKVVALLAKGRELSDSPLNICIQVNLCGESQKSGVSLSEVPKLIKSVEAQPMLNLRGLMFIPPKTANGSGLASLFRTMVDLKAYWVEKGVLLDVLSMGMSQDYELAVEHGSTMIRVGQAIFGER